jgi:hypothetical protein
MPVRMSGSPRKLLPLALALALCLPVGAAEQALALGSTNIAGPRILFDSTTSDFGQVLAGELVKHVFTFTNAGAGNLVISKVQPGCGCTSAGQWTRLVKPGETGCIPIQLNTAGFVGKIAKAILVTCNDPRQPILSLNLRGTARRAMDIQPPVAILNLQPDSPFGRAFIRITNHLEEPLLLSAPQVTNSTLGAALETIVFGREYAVVVSNAVALPPGAQAANIALRTSLANLPVISIPVLANVSPTFTVSPPQVNLALQTNSQVAYLAILSHSTNAVSLSDPQVTADGVKVTVEETKPGAAFIVSLSFPPGFRLAAGQEHSFSIRTSHPLCPVVQVPICQTSNNIPAAPWLSLASREAMTAPLPLVYQTVALDSLMLDQDQQAAIDELRQQFIAAIGGLSQNPGDPGYLARWQKAQPNADAMLRAVIGQRALMRFDMAPGADSGSE